MSKSLKRSYSHLLLTSAFILGNCFFLAKSMLAAPTPPGTLIDNTATGSFQGETSGTTGTVISNTVTLQVLEVAAISIANTGVTDAPIGVINAGTYQGIAGINTGDIVYFDFTISNDGNDPTKFFIPDTPSSLQGVTFNKATLPIQIIAVDPDGAAGTTPEKVLTTPVNVTTGNDTIALLGSPDGYIPPGGTVKVRVPVKVTETTVGTNISVTLGNTTPANSQNVAYVDSSSNNDVYTVDFADGTLVPTATGYTGTTAEANGNPANGDTITHRQEASNTQQVPLVETPIIQGFKSVKLTNDLDGSNSVSPNDELTWTVIYKNTSGVAIKNFQISDILNANVTRTAASAMSVNVKVNGISQTSPTLNATYTGTSPDNKLLDTTTPYDLPANATITINIPTKILNGTVNNSLITNQSTATADNLPAPVLTDNIDSSTTPLLTDVAVPTGSISQNQLPSIDLTVAVTGTPILQGYKSVKLTTDNGAAGLDSGDVVTWTVIYKNTGTVDIPNFQITDSLPTGVQRNATSISITATGSGQTAPVANSSYNGTGINTLFQNPVTLKAGAVIVVNIPVDIKAGTVGTQSNQSIATGSNLSASVNTDNVDSDTGIAEVPIGSIKQTQNATIDPTVINVPSGTPTPIVSGYKSVKLTNDADNTTTITPGDTLQWTVTYINTGTVDATSFQIDDTLPSGLTVVSGTPITIVTNTTQGSAPSVNSSYTGASSNTTLLQSPITLKAGGIITFTIPVTINTGTTGDKLNQAIASGANISVTNTDNTDSNPLSPLPTGVTVPSGSIDQTEIATSIDPTKVTIGSPASAGIPKISLVKRITAINGMPINVFVADAGTADPKWPDSDADPNNTVNTYLRGAIACPSTGSVICSAPQPTQTLEYTIYFLSNGTADATNVTICDLVPANTTFVSGAYGSNQDIAFLNSTSLQTTPSAFLTGLSDSDRGNFFQPNVLPPTTCKKPTTYSPLTAADNSNGLVVVDVAKKTAIPTEILPFATGSGDPAKSYGFVRFTVKVN